MGIHAIESRAKQVDSGNQTDSSMPCGVCMRVLSPSGSNSVLFTAADIFA